MEGSSGLNDPRFAVSNFYIGSMDSILMEDGTLSPELSMLIFFGASAICGYLLAVLAQASRRIPPGPWSWPLVGSINLLDEDFYLKLGELGKQYGEIFSINLGSRLVNIQI